MTLTFDATPIATPRLDDATMASRMALRADPALHPAFLARGAASSQLERLFRPGALCVTTGQQPGLLTGPLYTLYKGLSAVALAGRLERALDRPVVPVFWVAGDDHDYAEASRCHLLTVGNDIETLRLPDRPDDAPLTPMYRERVGEVIRELWDALERDTSPSEFRSGMLEWLRHSYTPDRDLASAFALALAELLGRFGLVVFQPTHPAAKRAMAPWLVRALERAVPLEAALTARGGDLARTGRRVPVTVGDGATTVMVEGRLGRDRLVLDDGQFHARRGGERFTLDDLRALARDAPDRLSPNVLLRPVVEAAILPTLAYLGGPGELAYLPQCDPLYRELDVAPQARVPRWSGRIVEARIRKVLEKYGIGPSDLELPNGQLEGRLVRNDMPAEAARAIETLRRTLTAEYERLRNAAQGLDPTLAKPIGSSMQQALNGVGVVEKRLVSHLKQRNDTLVQQVAKARTNLFPLREPQERVLSPVPFLIRYGEALLDALAAEIRVWFDALEPPSPTP